LVNILLVEPSPADRRWLELMLAEADIPHVLRAFPSALLALHVLGNEADHTFDVAIVNMMLPMLDIEDAVARLRSLPELAAAKVAITITAEHDYQYVPRGCHALMKPVDVEQLRAFLKPWAMVTSA
jgi:CheY-like chemotaxis protein